MIALHPHLVATRPAGAAAPALARGLILMLEEWVERHRQRRDLLALPEHLLKDIGISSSDAWQEGTKPFWRA